ncbi:beta-lactamase family protein [Jannaschia sp. S6380]|uniref:serine hydrolase domain-containing protein n=1 Tax=Jannaschia sp. S6380 TaxID=2926408 RepID=UPI001FF20E4E|nr:serine hydrolase domain-containing protein [Jannaschia sp. S6380]MCK0167709.1 beta-lactamase family protein [Jannaschia sp. S6380]
MDDVFETISAHLDRVTRAGRFLNAGLARIDGRGEVARVFGRVAPGGDPLRRTDLRLRMASISKAATARAVLICANRAGVPLTTPLSEVLDVDLPGVTLDHLLSHLSGLTDHGGYLIEPPQTPRAFLSDRPEAVSTNPPGTFFRYANLNYILLGIALEVIAGDRFDRILRREVLAPAGIAGGFNWAGVAPDDRNPLPVWQRHGDALTCEADGPDTDWGAEVIWRGGRGAPMADYRPGRDTTWFSPHAGLRMTVGEAARLARALGADDDIARAQRRARWRFDGTNGADCDGLFPAFGAGVTIYDGHPRIPGRLVGHAGHALGFTGGVWADRATGAGWAYFLNGSPDLTDGQDEEAFYDDDELQVMARI